MGFSSEGLSAAGTLGKAGSQVAAGMTKNKLEQANASIADQQAKSEIEAGGYNANLIRQKGAQRTGAQIANIGANNLQQGGTNAQVVAGGAAATERDALMTQNNSMRKAWGFEVQGVSDRFQGKEAVQGGILSGVGSLITGAGTLYKMRSANNPAGGGGVTNTVSGDSNDPNSGAFVGPPQ
jgi:hypothetical protein